MDRFDVLMERFGVIDRVSWSDLVGWWFRERVYHDGAWLEGRRIEPMPYWGA
jgi:hypothetical protein